MGIHIDTLLSGQYVSSVVNLTSILHYIQYIQCIYHIFLILLDTEIVELVGGNGGTISNMNGPSQSRGGSVYGLWILNNSTVSQQNTTISKNRKFRFFEFPPLRFFDFSIFRFPLFDFSKMRNFLAGNGGNFSTGICNCFFFLFVL